jgi:hypothetical protein
MPNTPIFNYPVPGDIPNDIPTHIGALALAIKTEQTRQGTLENRPLAGKRGRFYWATTRVDPFTNNVVPWNVLYRDDGTNWHHLTPSAPQNYSPTIHGTDSMSVTLQNGDIACNYIVEAHRVTYMCKAFLNYSGTASNSVAFSLPILAVST